MIELTFTVDKSSDEYFERNLQRWLNIFKDNKNLDNLLTIKRFIATDITELNQHDILVHMLLFVYSKYLEIYKPSNWETEYKKVTKLIYESNSALYLTVYYKAANRFIINY